MELHDYQRVGRDFLRAQDRAGLFLDMGLGKTAICLSAIEDRHLPVLVVAPKKVAETVWHSEKELWRPDLTLARAIGSPAERAGALAGGSDVVVISRDNFGDLEKVKRRPKFNTLIIDELSGYKSSASVRYKTTRRVKNKDGITHVWGLTGTPSPNGYMDLWSQIALLDDGARLGRNITAYRNRYFFPGRQIASGVVVEWLLRPESEGHIKDLIADLCLSMQSDGLIDLPPVVFNRVQVELPPRSRKAYKDMKDTLVADLKDVLGGEIHSAMNAAVLTSKLSQIAAGFMFVDDADIRDHQYTELNTVKLDALRDIAEFSTSPLLVFYRFIPEREAILAAFPEAVSINSKKFTMEKWNAGEIPMLVAHPSSAGHGLNLQHGGHTAVWTTLTWSLEEWEQANKRLHRQGQTQPVVIHTIMADGTVDSVILGRLVDKAVVQDSLMDHLESPL